MGLFDRFTKPKYQHKDWKKRLEGVKELDDQEILVQIAKNDYNISVRKAAIEKITDEQVLKDIFFHKLDFVGNDHEMSVHCTAVERINNESILKDIAINFSMESNIHSKYSNSRFKEYIVKRITSESYLIDIAKNANEEIIRWEAIDKINDQPTLIYIAKNDPRDYNRKRAVRKIDDEYALASVAKNESNFDVAREAFKKIKDESILEDVAKNASMYKVRRWLSCYLPSDYQEDPKVVKLYELEEDFADAAYESSGFNHSSEYGPYYKGMMNKAENMVRECKKLGEYGKANYYQRQYNDYKRRYDEFKLRH